MEQPNSAIGPVVRSSPHKLEMTLVTSVCSLTALMVIAVAAMLFVSVQQRSQIEPDFSTPTEKSQGVGCRV